MQTFITLAAFAASASAYSLTIQNNCKQDAYVWSCGDKLGEMQHLKAGQTWNEDYYSKEGDSAGPSIYVSDDTSNTDGNIAQLEYFYQTSVDKVWWDISLINGNPFPDIALGSDLKEMPYEACKAVQCEGNDCNGIVYKTHEQLAGTHDCPPSNLIMKLCDSTGEWTGAVSSPSKGSSNPAPVASYSHAAPPAPSPSSSSSVVASPTPSPSPSSSPVAEASSYSKAAPIETTTPAPAPTPSATKGGAFVEENSDGKLIVHTAWATTVVTAVVTQTASPQAYGHALNEGADGSVHGKREAHAHGHAHAHANGIRSRVRRHQHSA